MSEQKVVKALCIRDTSLMGQHYHPELQLGHYYTVDCIIVAASWTKVWIRELQDLYNETLFQYAYDDEPFKLVNPETMALIKISRFLLNEMDWTRIFIYPGATKESIDGITKRYPGVRQLYYTKGLAGLIKTFAEEGLNHTAY